LVKKLGSALETLTVSVLPVVERHAAPLVFKMTVVAVFVKPDHDVHLFSAGTVKPGSTKVAPSPPKPPSAAMQKAPPPGKVWPAAKVITPLLLNFSPVSAGVAVPEEYNRFSVPDGAVVLFAAGSACQRKF
jgi:hypothetical protein